MKGDDSSMARRKGRETYRKIITSPELLQQIHPENTKSRIIFIKNIFNPCTKA